MITNELKCSATGKSRYPTPGDAKHAIFVIARRNHGKNRNKKMTGKGGAKRYYKCSHCNGFHLTSTNYRTVRAYMKERIKENEHRSKGLIISNEEALQWKKDSLPFPKI